MSDQKQNSVSSFNSYIAGAINGDDNISYNEWSGIEFNGRSYTPQFKNNVIGKIELYITIDDKERSLGYYTPHIRNSLDGKKEVYLELKNGNTVPVGILEHILYTNSNLVTLYALSTNYQQILLEVCNAKYDYNTETKNVTLYVEYNGMSIPLQEFVVKNQNGRLYIELNGLNGEKLISFLKNRYNRRTDRNQTYLTIGGIQSLVHQAVIGPDDQTIRAQWNPENPEK